MWGNYFYFFCFFLILGILLILFRDREVHQLYFGKPTIIENKF